MNTSFPVGSETVVVCTVHVSPGCNELKVTSGDTATSQNVLTVTCPVIPTGIPIGTNASKEIKAVIPTNIFLTLSPPFLVDILHNEICYDL